MKYGIGLGSLEGRKEMFYFMKHSTHLNKVIWHQTYGKRPFR